MRIPAIAVALIGAAAAAAAVAQSDEDVPVLCDDEGFFVIDGSPAGDVYPGDGVRALVGARGRLDPAADSPFVLVRAADGSFERRPLRRSASATSQRPAFLTAAAAWARARSTFDPVAWDAPPPPTQRPAASPSIRPAAGADVASWGLAGMPIVRFRSTEAAFRFADVADRIAARLLAIEGDGRDHGTLRWTLHDLLLPAVWSANPEGARGVAECAVMFDGLPWRGRPRVAAVLRIADAELHRMETDAGVGYAALPEHVWAPADDPAPETRARLNRRRVLSDVDIVATDETLLDAVASRRGPSIDRDPAWRAARGDGPVPVAEALFAYLPASFRTAAASPVAARFDAFERALREFTGWRHLWRGWTGADAEPDARLPLTAPCGGPSALAGIVSVRVLTDAKGADVEVTFADDGAARAAAVLLARAAEPFTRGADVCARNRRDVAPLAVMDRARGDLAERCFVVLGWKPVCPCGGTYQTHPVTRDVTCSAHGSDARPVADVPAPKAVLRDVRAEGAVVRFRVPIDWR